MDSFIASVCHEANRAVCVAFGDNSQPAWKDAPEWQKQSALKGVLFAFANPQVTPSEQHDAWCADKRKDGWVYGPVKDSEAKTHPCLVDYDALPPEQRAKDHVFTAIVRSFMSPQKVKSG
jgi:hypothetical protein